MGIRVWPVIEGRDKYHHCAGFIEWKWLTDCVTSGVVLFAAQQMGITPVDKFQSSTRQDAIESMGIEEVEEYEEQAERRADGHCYIDGMLLWTEQREWFDAQIGLATVRALLGWLNDNPEAPDNCEPTDASPFLTGAAEYDAEYFAYILRELETILLKAQQAGQRFYLACDA